MDAMQTVRRDWTTRELADQAGVDPSRIRQLLLSKRLTGYKRGRDWLIPDSEARRWLEIRKQSRLI
jgi:excisionase family DNA binding protein